MRLVLGYHFDSGAYPDALGDREAVEGTAVVGPLGVVGILETRLGLEDPAQGQAVRIAQFRQAMDALCRSGEPFYAESFAADAWSTARRVLELRDQLRLSGWTGRDPGGSRRLAELAELEAAASLSPGLAERLADIRENARAYGFDGISRIELNEPEVGWPSWFRKLFALLREQGVQIEERDLAIPEGTGDLGGLRQALVGRQVQRDAVAGDGSLVCLRAETTGEAAEALAAWLASGGDSGNADVLLLSQSNGDLLDAALHRAGLPRLGGSRRSQWRAAMQLLPLALGIRWSPFDPQRMLEFLTAPLCPLPEVMRRRLTRALAQEPGIGGPEWRRAMESCNSWASKQEEGERFQADLAFWAGASRANPQSGLASTAIVEVCDRLVDWAGRGMSGEAAQVLPAMAGMARELAQAVRESAMGTVPKAQLNRMVDSVIGAGVAAGRIGEAAVWNSVSHPGQIHGDAGTIIWWNFCLEDLPKVRNPWTMAESIALAAAGVDLEDQRLARDLEAASWKRPALHARDRLVLVMPRRDQGEPVSPHPFWEEMVSGLGCSESRLLTVLGTEGAVIRRKANPFLLDRPLAVERVEECEVPGRVRDWSFPVGRVPRRETESPTGMEQLIKCPLSWLLRYSLGIRPGGSASLPGGNQLLGTFFHKIVAQLLHERLSWSATEGADRAAELFERNKEALAAELLLPGHGGHRERSKALFERAVQGLFERISRSGLTVAGSEHAVERVDKDGQKFRGNIDLLLRNAKGEPMVWDMKWSTRSTYRREQMEDGLALQLAAYFWMLDAGRAPVRAGYFMLQQNELISTPEPFLDASETVDVDLRQTWRDARAAYESRLDLLRRGKAWAEFEDEEAPPPEEGEASFRLKANCRYCDFDAVCGVRYEA